MKDGGPAFPHEKGPESVIHKGMTLRDYFAAKALQGFCANGGVDSQTKGEWYFQVAIPQSYAIADAMLKARES